MYYDSIYGNNNSKLNKELFDVNKQIASGLKIEYAKDDVRTFTETMRLDNEMTTLGQIKKSTQSGYKVANQTDEVMNEFQTSMNRMRTLLVQAANGTNSDTSLDAIADELRGIEKNLKGLANTSINGQFLFAGSAIDTKPISDDGTYHGNDHAMNAFVGSNNKQQYNLSGSDLFLGEELNRKREITANVVSGNLIDSTNQLTPDSTIRDLMGDIDDDKNTVNKNYFYIRGSQHDGTAFKKKVELDDTLKISDLMKEIRSAYGDNGKLVNVSLGSDGEIVVQDKQKGSSKLDFHMVGAVDFDDTGKANVDDIDELNNGESDYNKVKDDNDGDTNHLFVHEFIKSGFKPAAGAADKIEGIVYDRTQFSKNGAKLSSNVPQVLKEGNAFASPSTKISEVADLSKGTAGTLDGTTFNLTGKNINGDDYTATINFKSTANGGSIFSVDTDGDGVTDTDYKIYDMGNPRAAVNADDMTYQQLTDVMNMVVTNNLPSDGTADKYDEAVTNSDYQGTTNLSYDGKITFEDQTSGDTKATIALYDQNSDNFTKDASVMTFNANNALTVTDPKTDFFKSIDEMITAVEDHKLYPDAKSGHLRNVGIENAIQKIDDLQDHVFRMHSKVGAQSNTLNTSLERTQILEVSTMSLRSDVIDTDLAESSLRLQQLTTNYQAMLSTVGRISKLSLVNYL
jgi:flagellar hook-associated protein 3 FlgL